MSVSSDREELERLRQQLAHYRRRSPSQRFLDSLTAMPFAAIVWDKDLRVQSWNAGAENLFAYSAEQVVGQDLVGLLVPPPAQPLIRGVLCDLLERARASRSTNINRAKDGAEILCEWCNTPLYDDDGVHIGAVSVVRDVSKAKGIETRLQETMVELEAAVQDRTRQLADVHARLRREADSRVASAAIASRLASIRIVAAGFAHEVVGPLRAIGQRASDALKRFGDSERVVSDLQKIMDDVRRCSVIVASVVKYLDDERTEKWANDLNPLVIDAIGRAQDELGDHSVEFDLQLAEHLPPVVLNPEEIIEAFTYLVIAVASAMSKGATIEISTRESGSSVAVGIVERAASDAASGRHPLGHGHMNLSSSHGIMFDHEGNIDVDFDAESSAAITLEFPVAAEKPGRLNHRNAVWYQDSTAGMESGPDADSTVEIVLVVDDDDHVRLVVVEALKRCGYRTLSASSSEEALTVFDSCGQSIDLLVADVELPGMKGPELAEILKVKSPVLEVLFVSGYSGGILAPHSTFLAKPFTPHVLMDKVRQVLDTRGVV